MLNIVYIIQLDVDTFMGDRNVVNMMNNRYQLRLNSSQGNC